MRLEQYPRLALTVRGFLALAALSLMASGCTEDEEPDPAKKQAASRRNPAVVRCQKGVQRAVTKKDLAASTKLYFESCAGIYAEPGCRKAWKRAAEADPDEQMKIVTAGCRKAYCPSFKDKKLAACKKGFEPTPEAITRAWPPLHEAILDRDVGAQKQQVSLVLLSFYAHRKKLEADQEKEPTETGDASTPDAGADKAAKKAESAAKKKGQPDTADPGGSPGKKATKKAETKAGDEPQKKKKTAAQAGAKAAQK